MINSISSNPANLEQMQTAVTTAANAPEIAKAPAEPEVVSKAAPAVTVQISEAAQVKLLKSQGQNATLIATSLGITKDAVNQYLGITS